MFQFLMMVIIIYGLVSLFAPEAIWELGERMRYKDSDREPSTASLVLIRLEGLILIGAALFGLFQSCGG